MPSISPTHLLLLVSPWKYRLKSTDYEAGCQGNVSYFISSWLLDLRILWIVQYFKVHFLSSAVTFSCYLKEQILQANKQMKLWFCSCNRISRSKDKEIAILNFLSTDWNYNTWWFYRQQSICSKYKTVKWYCLHWMYVNNNICSICCVDSQIIKYHIT